MPSAKYFIIRGHSITTWTWFCPFTTTYLPPRGHFLPWTWTKIKIKSFESIIYKNLHIKKLMLGTSEFRGLVNKTFVPATHRTSVSVFFVHQFLTWETIWEKLENCFLTKSQPNLFDIHVLACLYHFAFVRIFLR